MANYRFVVRWENVAVEEAQIGLALTADPAADEGDVETAFDGLWDAVRDKYDPFWVLKGYTWYEGVSGVPPTHTWGDTFRTTARDVPGADTNPAVLSLPPQLAVVVTFPMQLTLKRHRGRVYMPAPSTTALQDDGRYANAGEMADAWRDFCNSIRADGWTPCVLARVLGAAAFLPLDRVRVNNTFDTQRRRGHVPSTNVQERLLT